MCRLRTLWPAMRPLEISMPVYDYDCMRCGPFTMLRPMAECKFSAACPRCGEDAARAFLTAPYVAAMPADQRLAHATNEQSAHAPRRSNQGNYHGAGCNCCGQKATQKAAGGRGDKNAAKSFPGRRPWMLSH
jgi:putative FmdB family regulatory protein